MIINCFYIYSVKNNYILQLYKNSINIKMYKIKILFDNIK